MKDKFFRFLEQLYGWIYGFVLNIVYIYYGMRATKGTRKLSSKEKKDIKAYWKKITGINIHTREYRWYKSKGVEINPEIIPNSIYHSKIEPFYNNIHLLKGFSDKNYIDLIIGKEYTPDTVIHCINGELLDKDYLPIKSLYNLSNLSREMICKPSLDSCGGRGIQFIKADDISDEKIRLLISQYGGNFVLQAVIKQHDFFSQFNPESINTIRIVSFLKDGEVYILSSFLRIGAKGNRIDNVSAGGYFIPIDDEWRLKDVAFTEDIKTKDFVRHELLFDRIPFKGMKIPNGESITNCIKELHFRLSHFRIINWDVVLDEDGNVKVVEYNLIDSSPSFHQINVGPIFGDMTEKVLRNVYNGKR